MADRPAAAPPRALPIVGAAPIAPPLRGPIEPMEPGDVLADYTLVPYDPVTSPVGKLRSVNVLYASFAAAGVEDEGRRVVDRLRAQLGPFRTVWGVKLRPPGEITGWELYFYDPKRERADLAIERVRDVLAPAITVDAAPPHALPWHMFSVELDVAALRDRAPVSVDVYVGASRRRDGADRSYKLRGSELLFENVYTFHRPGPDVDHLLERIACGVHFTRQKHLLSALWPPELLDVGHVCVANKRRADALYFSRITLDQARFALSFYGVAGPVSAFLAAPEHAGRLDHLRWDVGVDYVDDAGALRFTKGGLYGSF